MAQTQQTMFKAMFIINNVSQPKLSVVHRFKVNHNGETKVQAFMNKEIANENSQTHAVGIYNILFHFFLVLLSPEFCKMHNLIQLWLPLTEINVDLQTSHVVFSYKFIVAVRNEQSAETTVYL